MLIAMFAVLLSVAFAGAGAAKEPEQDAVRRWKVEYLRNAKWVGTAEFDSRKEAQAKLDKARGDGRSARAGTLNARVVPTDWSRWEHLGKLSAKYESGGRASGTVSTGKGDPGGVSYGSYQLSSKVGTAQRFTDLYYADWFYGTKPGSAEFTKQWIRLAAERQSELAAYEHLFIADTHYQPFADRLKNDLGLDLEQHSNALRDVAWSVGVQHGAGNKIFSRALQPVIDEHRLNELNDKAIIELVYAERGRVDDFGVSVYFSKSSPQVQKSVLKRFENEKQDALRELAEESGTKGRR